MAVLDPEQIFARHQTLLAAAPRIFIAYSGGLDSRVLLEVASRVLGGERLMALHINHGVHPQANEWQELCRAEASRLGIGYQCESLEFESLTNFEDQARQKRYAVLANNLRRGEWLLLAHHADDQAETLLFRLVRGAGLRGMAGMPAFRRLGAGKLLRPLLPLRREDLLAYARAHNLNWIEDPSNQDLQFSRNYLRSVVLPALTERWPASIRQISESAQSLREAHELLEEYADLLIGQVDSRVEPLGYSLSLDLLLGFAERQQRLVLRSWLSSFGLACGKQQLYEIQRQLEGADNDKQVRHRLGAHTLCKHHDRLYLLDLPNKTDAFSWDGRSDMRVDTTGCLKPFSACASGNDDFTVRFRQGGERCKPLASQHSRSLKKLLQEKHLAPWLRNRLPLIYQGNELIAVANVCSCKEGIAVPDFRWRDGFTAAENS